MTVQLNPDLLLIVPLAPLAGSMIAGLLGTRFFGNLIGRTASHSAASCSAASGTSLACSPAISTGSIQEPFMPGLIGDCAA